MYKRSFGNLLAHDAPLHRLVKDEGGAGEQRREGERWGRADAQDGMPFPVLIAPSRLTATSR